MIYMDLVLFFYRKITKAQAPFVEGSPLTSMFNFTIFVKNAYVLISEWIDNSNVLHLHCEMLFSF